MKRFFLLVLTISFGLLVPRANAAEIVGSVKCGEIGCWLTDLGIYGQIDASSPTQFSRLIQNARDEAKRLGKPVVLAGATVILDSPGGIVADAMAIGRMMRRERMHAFVNPGAQCSSSCVLIYAGAVSRAGRNPTAKIGIHQPYLPVPTQKVDGDTIRKPIQGCWRKCVNIFGK